MGKDVGIDKPATRSNFIGRPRLYRNTKAYVALMPMTLPGKVAKQRSRGEAKKSPERKLKVGDRFQASELRFHIIKFLFLRGRIGPAGHPWTERAVERVNARHERDVKAKADRLKREEAARKPDIADKGATAGAKQANGRKTPPPRSNGRKRGASMV